MSKWIRGIYNATANFNLSNAIRAASGRTLDRDTDHVCEKSVKCNKPNKSDKSNKSNNECGSDTDCLGCAPFSCARYDPNSNHYIGNVNDAIERDYNEYIDATGSTKGKDIGTRVWVSNEPRHFKQTSNGATTNIDHVAGVSTGVTI